VGRDDFQVSATVEGERARLVLDAVDEDGKFQNFLQFRGRCSSPKLKGQELQVTQTAPGRYETTFLADEVGTYFVNLTWTDQDGRKGLFTTGIPISFSPEFLKLDANEPLLRSVQGITGGREFSLGDPRGVFRREGLPESRSSQDIWPALLLAAILLFPADVFVRRVWIPWDKVWAFVVATYGRVVRGGRRIEIASPVERLLRAKPKLKGGGLPVKRFQARPEAPKEGVRAPDLGKKVTEKKTAPKPPAPEKKPKPGEPSGPGTYTGRLLDAKKRAFKRKR
jgi:hypothetical protein